MKKVNHKSKNTKLTPDKLEMMMKSNHKYLIRILE